MPVARTGPVREDEDRTQRGFRWRLVQGGRDGRRSVTDDVKGNRTHDAPVIASSAHDQPAAAELAD